LDLGVLPLVAANGTAFVIASFQDWQVQTLLLVYWCQSLLFGVSHFCRLLAVKHIYTRPNSRDGIEPLKPWTGLNEAAEFAVIYGGLNAVFLFWVLVGLYGPSDQPGLLFWVCVAAFALSQYFEYRDARLSDRQGLVSVHRLMIEPAARFAPMMFVTILAIGLGSNPGFLTLFCGLKTLADLLAYAVTRRQLIGRFGPRS
jgi:hypothetical protein